MSRRRPPRTTECHTPTKQIFATRDAAETVAAYARRTFEPAMQTYRCGCGWWHLTSHPRQEQTA